MKMRKKLQWPIGLILLLSDLWILDFGNGIAIGSDRIYNRWGWVFCTPLASIRKGRR